MGLSTPFGEITRCAKQLQHGFAVPQSGRCSYCCTSISTAAVAVLKFRHFKQIATDPLCWVTSTRNDAGANLVKIDRRGDEAAML